MPASLQLYKGVAQKNIRDIILVDKAMCGRSLSCHFLWVRSGQKYGIHEF